MKYIYIQYSSKETILRYTNNYATKKLRYILMQLNRLSYIHIQTKIQYTFKLKTRYLINISLKRKTVKASTIVDI